MSSRRDRRGTTMASKYEEEYQKLVQQRQRGQFRENQFRNLRQKVYENDTSQSEVYQRFKWDELRYKIDEEARVCDENNIQEVVLRLFKLNLERGKGLLIRSIMKYQEYEASPVYTALISVINSKISDVGELFVNRLIVQFKKYYMRNNYNVCLTSLVSLCFLYNHGLIDSILLLQIFEVLLTRQTSDSIGLVITMLEVSGKKLLDNEKSINIVFDKLRSIIHEDKYLNRELRFGIENLFKLKQLKSPRFKLPEKFDLVEDDDIYVHFITLDGEHEVLTELNQFQYDENYEENEKLYQKFIEEDIFGEDSDSEEEQEEKMDEQDNEVIDLQEIKDMTESNLIEIQKKIYLTIMSSMSADEAVHKLLKLKDISPETLIDMVIKCCAQEKTYSKYFGVIGDKICSFNESWHQQFVKQFKTYFESIHHYENNQLRNIGKFFGHLFASDKLAIEMCWDEIKLTEADTNSASRVLIKFIFQEMIEEIGIKQVKEMIEDEVVKRKVNGIFPIYNVTAEDADDIRFSINFFTAIGLGVLTEEMRQVLRELPGRGRSRSRSYSGSESGSYRSYSGDSRGRSRSRSYSRSRSRSFSRSPSPER